MPNQTYFYNIHGILNIEVFAPKGFIGKRALDFLHSFRVDSPVGRATIVLEIGNFEPDLNGCFVVNHHTSIRDGFIHTSRKFGRMAYSVEYLGINVKKTRIRVDAGIRGFFSSIYRYAVIQSMFLQPIIEKYLLAAGIATVHAAGLGDGEDVYVLFGRGGTFKTTLAMKLYKEQKMNYFSDDKILISRSGDVFSYQTLPEIFEYRVRNCATESIGFLHKVLFLSSRSRSKSSEVSTVRRGKLKKFLFLRRIESGNVGYSNLENMTAVNRLLNSYRLEKNSSQGVGGYSSGVFNDLMLCYEYIEGGATELNATSSYQNIVESFMENRGYAEITSPTDYGEDYYQAVLASLRG